MSRRAGLLVAVVASLAYLVLVARQLDKPLMYDDANFALAAKAVAETGLPYGNQGWMSERGDFSQREQWALWHPPLYVYAEGLAARVGGWAPPVLRVVGVLGGLATAALTFTLGTDLVRAPPGDSARTSPATPPREPARTSPATSPGDSARTSPATARLDGVFQESEKGQPLGSRAAAGEFLSGTPGGATREFLTGSQSGAAGESAQPAAGDTAAHSGLEPDRTVASETAAGLGPERGRRAAEDADVGSGGGSGGEPPQPMAEPTARSSSGEAARGVAAGVAVALAMLSPIVVQSTLVLDIDFALLLPLTLGFVILYLRLEGSRWRWLWLAPLFCVLLWAKMTNPLTLVGVILVWQVLRGKPLRAALHVVGIGLAGAALFGLSWLVIGRWLGFPLDMPFAVNLVEARDSADVARRAYTSPGAFIEGLQPTAIWLGPGLVALGLTATAVRGALLAQCWRVRSADLLIGVLGILVLGYVNKYAGWLPKYQVAMAPVLACLAAPLIAHAWCARPKLFTSVVGLLAVASSLITARLVRDDWALQRTWQIDPTAAAWLLAAVVLAVLAGLVWRAPAAAAAAVAALVGLALGWSVAVDLVQQRAAYATDYWYGTTGTAEAATWVDSHLAADQTYVAAKEVAIRSRDLRYVDQDNLVYSLSLGRSFDGTWAGEPLHALVTWQREPYVAALFSRALSTSTFRETARFGDYVIYEPAS